LLYDLTSTYFEANPPFAEDDKRKFGHSRDRRSDCVQVVIALVVTPQGLPLAYEVLPGNTADNTTLRPFLARIEKRTRVMDRIAAGVIQGYTAIVDAKRLQYDITAFIRVNVDGSENYPAFVEAVTPMEEVLEAHSITGDGSHILKVRTRNTTTLERLLARLQALPGVGGTSSSIVLSTFKETRTVATEPMELFTYDTTEQPGT